MVLISYNADRGTVDFRHYIIKVKPYGVSKRVRRVLEGAASSAKSSSGVLDLGKEKDVSDFLLRKRGEPGPEGGYESAASSAESIAGEDADAVDLAEDYVGRNNKKGQRRAVRLEEVGPRMELRLIKITEGVPGKEGAVMYHEFGMAWLFVLNIAKYLTALDLVKKSKRELVLQKVEHAAKVKLKKQRREEQERNVQRKKANPQAKAEDQDDEESDHEGQDDGIGIWDDDEDISEGEDEEAASGSEGESSEEEPPAKRVKVSKKS